MWCTRWYLPLILLPIPAASPFFLVVFLFSLSIHARPCVYCIIMLTTLFVSSCYWQPMPIDTPLAIPWASNITTYREALNATLRNSYHKSLPDTIRPADRCWCDTSGSFFEPFNVTRWEDRSVETLAIELLRETLEELKAKNRLAATSTNNATTPISEPSAGQQNPQQTAEATPTTQVSQSVWSWLTSWRERYTERGSHSQARKVEDTLRTLTPQPSPSAPVKYRHPREYDLSRYGIGLVVDTRLY